MYRIAYERNLLNEYEDVMRMGLSIVHKFKYYLEVLFWFFSSQASTLSREVIKTFRKCISALDFRYVSLMPNTWRETKNLNAL